MCCKKIESIAPSEQQNVGIVLYYIRKTKIGYRRML